MNSGVRRALGDAHLTPPLTSSPPHFLRRRLPLPPVPLHQPRATRRPSRPPLLGNRLRGWPRTSGEGDASAKAWGTGAQRNYRACEDVWSLILKFAF